MTTRTTACHCLDAEVIPLVLQCLGRTGHLLSKYFSSGKHKVFTSITVNPNGFSDWRDFYMAYQASVFLKKYPLLSTGVDTSAVAIDKFLESERKCSSINAKLTHYQKTLSFRDRSIFEQARLEIKRILGKFSWDSVLPFLSHGPGAAVGLKREFGHPWYKYGKENPSVTGECLALIRALCSYSDLWKQRFDETSDFDLVRSSKVAVVPKDARSDRTIAIEPLWNMFFQKGLGGLMRSRLARSGCNLNDQTINQNLARIGSETGLLSTIDLSSASDSISRVLVERLLPEEWVAALSMVRTTRAKLLDGTETYLQKFSSMGNGFTFELESLIFLALGRACSSYKGGLGHDVSVYGDDIIINTGATELLVEVLSAVGFKTNEEKSFSSGPFRESCGKHYFLGHDVSPFFLKRKISGVEDLFYLLNSIKRLSFRFLGIGFGLDDRFEQCYRRIYSLVPPRFRKFNIPEGIGDTGIVQDFDEVCPSPQRNSYWVEGWTIRHLVRKFEANNSDGLSGLLLRIPPCLPCGDLYPDVRENNSGLKRLLSHDSIRPEVHYLVPQKRYKLRSVKIKVPRWPSLGSWVKVT